MTNKIELENFSDSVLDKFAQLDDFDIISALKEWQNHDDFILSSLSKMIINRDLLKIKLSSEKFPTEEIHQLLERFSKQNAVSIQDAHYFIFKGKIKNQAYSKEAEPIHILKKDKTIEDVVEASDQLNLKALSKPVTKYYICYPKQLLEN
jgi:HD superfamily phosphohydrolase